MSNSKALIAVAAHVALAIFVLAAIFSAFQGGDDNYNTKSAGVVVEQAQVVTEQPEEEPQVETVTEVVEPEVVEQVDATVEEATEAVANVEAEVVEPVEQVVATETEQVVTEVEQLVADTEAAVEQVVQTELAPVVAEVEQAAPVAADAQVHVVTAEGLKYNPLVVTIAVGDTVAWENMSSHDTQAIEGLIPEGAEYWHSSMGENFQRTFTQEGIYIYKCTPHFGAGMGGVIIVGNPVNLDAIKAASVKGATKRLVKKAIQAAEAL